jgi:3',5'-cyclic-AMP phosphodiesterase
MSELSRRELFTIGAGAILAPAWLPETSSHRKRSLRVAFATDMHVQPDPKAEAGWTACLKHIHALSDRPDLIVTGGDLIMDAFAATPERTEAQWEVFQRALREHAAIPVRHTIGNHDVFGWADRAKYEKDVRFGKDWACGLLGMKKPYYSFDQGGWHFIILDSTFPAGAGYTAKLDNAQFEWLQSDLAATPKTTPVVVVSHIPLLMVCAIFDGENEQSGNWVIPGSYMHIDARRIKDLFLKHPNVKLCLSGHEHQIDRILYNNATYYCAGAVSAAWWGGKYFECTYGYALVDLFVDGTFEVNYTTFEWSIKE